MKANKSILLNIFLLSVFFPWVKILPIDVDTQPNSLLLALLIIIFNFKTIKINKYELIFLIIPTINFIHDGLSVESMRGWVGYFSFVVFIVIGRSINWINNLKRKIFPILLVYFFCGLVQIYINPDAFILISNREAGYGGFQGRGVESLSVEPTFLGFHMMAIGLLLFLIEKIRDFKTTSLLLLCVFYISKSTSAIATILMALCVFVSKMKARYILMMAVVFLVFAYASLRDSRFFYLSQLLLSDSNEILNLDESMYTRLMNIYICFAEGFERIFLGHGYLEFQKSLDMYNIPGGFILGGSRPTTMLGTVFYECGAIQLSLFILIMFNSLKVYGKDQFRIFVILILMLIQSVTVSYPLIPFLLGVFQREQKNLNDTRSRLG